MPGGEITAEDANCKHTDSKANLTQIVTNFETSGNGEGKWETRVVANADYGVIGEEQLTQVDRRSAIVIYSLGHRPHHLLSWVLNQETGTFRSVLNILDGNTGADGEAGPASTGRSAAQNHRRKAQEDAQKREERRQLRKVSVGSFSSLVVSDMTSDIRAETQILDQLVMQQFTEEDPRVLAFIKRRIIEQQERIAELQENISLLKASRSSMSISTETTTRSMGTVSELSE